MKRTMLGVVAGIAAWLVIATLLNLILRATLAGYHAAETTLAFTLAMKLARLAESALACLSAGYTAAWVAQGNQNAPRVVGIVLLALFLPMHVKLWNRFPVWYHLTFLVSLLPLTVLGGLLRRPSRTGGSGLD
jgi:ABC-type methionine transport system permease subunit